MKKAFAPFYSKMTKNLRGVIMKDATYYAQELKSKNLSIDELLAQIVTTAEQNQKLNAFVGTFNVADAKREYEYTQNGIFGGLPLPLKILGQDKAGWAATSASQIFKEAKANQTNNFVAALADNGLTPFGQTNAPEFGFKNITDPTLYGVTRNPWNLQYSPGGSSGGAAAAVAAGIFPLAAASDGGGSIRIPASFSGLIGLKPTRGTIPTGPTSWRDWQGAAINFALTVSMRDTKTLFYGMRGQHTAAPYQAPKIEWEKKVEKRKLKIAYTTTSPVGSQVSDEAKQAVAKAVTFLQAAGHDVVEIAYPLDGIQLIRAYYKMNGAETAAMFAEIEQAIGRKVTKEDMEPMTWAIYQSGLKTPAAKYVATLQAWDQAAFVMEELFKDYDLFLTPTTAYSAPKIEAELVSKEIFEKIAHASLLDEDELDALIYEMFENSLTLSPFTQLANLTGEPAISLPTHVTASGLPLGIQFMAAKGREDLLFQIGYIFEENEKFQLPQAYQE